MTLIEYLRERHPTVNSLTAFEARVIGIRYPLQHGWVSKYSSLELPDEIVAKLRSERQRRYQQQSYQKRRAKVAKSKSKLDRKLDKETATSLKKLVQNIVAQGCSDAQRLAQHLNKPHKAI